MKIIYALLLSLMLFSCGKEPKEEQLPETDTAPQPDTVRKAEQKVIISDKSLYSQEFISEIEDLNYPSPLKLERNYLVTEGDTVYFPEELKLSKDYRFTAFTDSHFYQLAVKRINLTSIEYDLAVFEKEKQILTSNGVGHLGAGFFLGSETDEDDETGEGYLSIEYSSTGKDAYSIRVGEPDGQGRLRAVVTGGKPNPVLNPGITLRESM